MIVQSKNSGSVFKCHSKDDSSSIPHDADNECRGRHQNIKWLLSAESTRLANSEMYDNHHVREFIVGLLSKWTHNVQRASQKGHKHKSASKQGI